MYEDFPWKRHLRSKDGASLSPNQAVQNEILVGIES
jgi:hypothetical protein